VVSFTPLPLYLLGKIPCIHWIGGWVGPIAGLDKIEKRKFFILPDSNPCPLVVQSIQVELREIS
jgi:hypothetical protein